jgi:hypothetical protein
VSLRRGQHKLREMSAQRQLFNRPEESGGIRAFLVPKTTQTGVAQVRRTSSFTKATAQGRGELKKV